MSGEKETSSTYTDLIKKEHDILLNISQNIISTLDYEKVLQIISDGMSELLEIETAAIYLIEGKEELHLGATTPPLDPNLPDSLRKASISDHPQIKKTISSRRPIYIQDTQKAQLSPAESGVVELRNLRSLLFFPFIKEEQVLGVLILGTSNKARSFSESEIELGLTVANQLSIGIQNARLHHDLQIRNSELSDEINQRKKFEQALINSRTHLSNALRIAKLGHWEYEAQKEQFTFTDEFYALYKTNVKDQQGSYHMSADEYAVKFVHKDDQQIVKTEIQRAIDANDENFSDQVEHKIVYANGQVGDVLVRFKTIQDQNGKTVKIFGVNQDITEYKKIEKELKDHQDNLEKLVRAKTKALDQAVEELKATNIELSSKNSIIEKQNRDLIDTLKNLQETQSMLVQSEKMASLGVLTAGVAHEINNPLNFIMGAYEGLKKNLPEGVYPLQKEMLDVIKIGLDRAQSIVKSLNQLSSSNKESSEVCQINDIINNCLIVLQNQTKDRIAIQKLYAKDSYIVRGNVGNLHQVFLNIITNAIQSIKGQGEIAISITKQNNSVVTEISDTGCGIPYEHISKITDPFFTTKPPGEGTGLGLSIAYKIIQEHHGSLEFNSTPNKGTKAKVVLPLNS